MADRHQNRRKRRRSGGEEAAASGEVDQRRCVRPTATAARPETAASRFRADGAANEALAEDEVLSPDEELFVTAFVEYWQRRGTLVLGGTE
jgi:hypothetical protein